MYANWSNENSTKDREIDDVYKIIEIIPQLDRLKMN